MNIRKKECCLKINYCGTRGRELIRAFRLVSRDLYLAKRKRCLAVSFSVSPGDPNGKARATQSLQRLPQFRQGELVPENHNKESKATDFIARLHLRRVNIASILLILWGSWSAKYEAGNNHPMEQGIEKSCPAVSILSVSSTGRQEVWMRAEKMVQICKYGNVFIPSYEHRKARFWS